MAKAKILGKREQGDGFETKLILKRQKEKSDEKETLVGSADSLQLIKRMVELLEKKSDQSNLISKKETVEGLDEPPNFVEEVAARQKTLFVAHLSRQTKISDIIGFFNSVGEVVRVQLIVDRKKGLHSGYGFVDFASANEAKKALEKKNGEYLCGHKINLDLAKIALYPPRPKYCIDHKVDCYEDYLRREGLLIEENETMKGHDEDPNSAELQVVKRIKTLFVANLSPQTDILDVCKFFHNVGQVVSLRLIVNHEGRHVGYGFVEFFSANEAKKALEKKGEYLHDHKIYLDVVKIAPYSPMEGHDEDPNSAEEVVARKKTLFVANLPPQAEILDVCKFFHNTRGKIVSQRLIVNDEGKHVGCGFLEFESAHEAKKALKKKQGEYLHHHKIFLDMAKIAPYPPRPKYNLAEKLWFEDYLRQESLVIEEVDWKTKPIPRFCGTKTSSLTTRKALLIEEDEA